MHNFEKLSVYKKSLAVTRKIYDFSKTLPDNERFGLISQIRRAATSSVLNIAEGSGAGTNLEFRRFLRISLRSKYEVHAILDVITELRLSSEETIKDIKKDLDELGAMISGLIKKLNN